MSDDRPEYQRSEDRPGSQRDAETQGAYQRDDAQGAMGNMENAVTGVIAATGDLARVTIDEVSGVGEDLIHAVGRIGVVTVTEVMNVIGTITGGLGAAAGSMRGRRGR